MKENPDELELLRSLMPQDERAADSQEAPDAYARVALHRQMIRALDSPAYTAYIDKLRKEALALAPYLVRREMNSDLTEVLTFRAECGLTFDVIKNQNEFLDPATVIVPKFMRKRVEYWNDGCPQALIVPNSPEHLVRRELVRMLEAGGVIEDKLEMARQTLPIVYGSAAVRVMGEDGELLGFGTNFAVAFSESDERGEMLSPPVHRLPDDPTRNE